MTDIEFPTHYTKAKLAGFFFSVPAAGLFSGRPGRLTHCAWGRELAGNAQPRAVIAKGRKKENKTNNKNKQTIRELHGILITVLDQWL